MVPAITISFCDDDVQVIMFLCIGGGYEGALVSRSMCGFARSCFSRFVQANLVVK